MSRIFAAEEIAFGRSVVLKVLPPDLAVGVSLDRFKREIQVAAQLNHPHVVPILTAGQADDLLYYTMPLIGGDTLRALMERERQLPYRRVLEITRGIAAALSYAHARNIVHRDIKPENVLLEHGNAMVTDFGIARAIEKAADLQTVTSTGVTVGTPTYMSPEQAAAEKHIDGRSDIYSLGCVVFEMLAGEPPFTAASVRTLISKHLNEPAPSISTSRPDLPPAAQRALASALAKSPADRYATPEEFVAALEDETATRPMSGRDRTSRRRRIALLAALALAVPAVYLGTKAGGAPEDDGGHDPLRIAILPLDAPAGDSQLMAIGRGLAYDLVSAMRSAPEVSVVSYYATQALPPGTPMDSLRARFGVGTVITGRVDRRSDSIFADLRLVNTRTSLEEWRAVRSQLASQWIDLRDTVVGELGRQLLARLGPELRMREWRAGTRSQRAWELRQRAQLLTDRESSLEVDPRNFGPQLELLASAESLLVQATAADQRWPEPLVARGWLMLRRTRYLPRGPAILGQIDSALVLAERAVALRPPRRADALTLRGTLRYERWTHVGDDPPGTRDSARADLLAAVAEDSTQVRAWNTLSAILRDQRDFDGAARAIRRSMAVDAFAEDVPRNLSRLIFNYLVAENYPAARALCDDVRARYQRDVSACELNVLGYSGRGRPDIDRTWELVAQMERAGPWPLVAGVSPDSRFYVSAVLARSGLRDSSRRVLDATTRHLDEHGARSNYALAEAHVRVLLGEADSAMALMERAAEANPGRRELIRTSPWFASLREHPRFRRLTRAE
jgi:eukaryotic-like serine/threonine-protein kinase